MATKTVAVVIAIVVIIAAIAAALFYTMAPAPPSPTPTTITTPTTTPATTPTTVPTVAPTTPTVVTPAPRYKLHKTVLYIIANDEMTRIQLYKTGVVDTAVIAPARWKDLNGTRVDGFYLVLEPDPSKPRLTIQYVLFNTMKEPFNITEVRQALLWAVPYKTILEQVFVRSLHKALHHCPQGHAWVDRLQHYSLRLQLDKGQGDY
jgi:peptide/nickel transport system substrate-binding protein